MARTVCVWQCRASTASIVSVYRTPSAGRKWPRSYSVTVYIDMMYPAVQECRHQLDDAVSLSTGAQCGTVWHLLCATIACRWTRSSSRWRRILSDSDEYHPASLSRFCDTAICHRVQMLPLFASVVPEKKRTAAEKRGSGVFRNSVTGGPKPGSWGRVSWKPIM